MIDTFRCSSLSRLRPKQQRCPRPRSTGDSAGKERTSDSAAPSRRFKSGLRGAILHLDNWVYGADRGASGVDHATASGFRSKRSEPPSL
jgi:hypothetical protein